MITIRVKWGRGGLLLLLLSCTDRTCPDCIVLLLPSQPCSAPSCSVPPRRIRAWAHRRGRFHMRTSSALVLCCLASYHLHPRTRNPTYKLRQKGRAVVKTRETRKRSLVYSKRKNAPQSSKPPYSLSSNLENDQAPTQRARRREQSAQTRNQSSSNLSRGASLRQTPVPFAWLLVGGGANE